MKNIQNNPIVSVIIPTYNRAHFIVRAIESVQAQSFTNWELIIVDDGSKDGTEELVKKILEQDKRIFFIKQESNKGVSAARNRGIKESKGRYVAFLDSDDIWLPEKLQSSLDIFENQDKKLGLVYTSAIFLNDKTGELRIKKARAEGDIYLKEVAGNPIGGTSRVMIRAECVDVCGNFDESLRCHEDWDLWIRITGKYRVAKVDEPQMKYFEGNSDSLSLNSSGLIEGYKALWKKYNINSLSTWIRVEHYLRLGHRLCYYGVMNPGRQYLLKAFLLRPWNPRNAILFLASMLGKKFYRRLTFFIMKTTG